MVARRRRIASALRRHCARIAHADFVTSQGGRLSLELADNRRIRDCVIPGVYAELYQAPVRRASTAFRIPCRFGGTGTVGVKTAKHKKFSRGSASTAAPRPG